MATSPPPPLSSTVSAVFKQFLKDLKEAQVLGEAAQKALADSLQGQKLDHETLREAIFTPELPK